MPNSDATILGGQLGENAFPLYRAEAIQKAAKASDATRAAFNVLYEQLRGSVDQNAANARSTEASRAATAKLCGNAAVCNPTTHSVGVTTDDLRRLNRVTMMDPAACTGDELRAATDPRRILECFARVNLDGIETRVTLLREVRDALWQDRRPDASVYGSGLLARAVQSQWDALTQLAGSYASVLAAYHAVRNATALPTEVWDAQAKIIGGQLCRSTQSPSIAHYAYETTDDG